MSQTSMAAAFAAADRRDIAIITNHGYAGADLPVGGAPDTGGQNMYVNSLARALDRAGWRVTIFARGGFPYFQSDRMRVEPEFLADHVRYIFVPGGGDTFVRKEDIAEALDEQADWLDAFIRQEADARGCRPWQVYALVNTHYWDAAVLGCRLVERWKNDVAADALSQLLQGALSPDRLKALQDERHRQTLGAQLLAEAGSPADPLADRLRVASATWLQAYEGSAEAVEAVAGPATAGVMTWADELAPAVQPVAAADRLGHAVLARVPQVRAFLQRDLDRADTHVWTPHSLGELKDDNFRLKSIEERRALKFCERRNHERMICDRTRLIVATSTEICEKLRSHYGVDAARILYFPPGIDLALFRTYEDHELADTWRYLAEVSGLDEARLRSATLIFETSRMDRTKRKDLVLAAFARIAEQASDALLFIGGGPNNAVFKSLGQQLAATPALAGRAFLTGFIPDEHIGPLFDMAGIYVSASEMEGFGMSVSQGAAAGAAVVSSDLIPFSIQYAGEAALIVRAGDEAAFAEAMLRLASNPDERKQRADALFQCVQALDWNMQAVAFIDQVRRTGMPLDAD